MPNTDFLYVFQWWLMLFVGGLAFLPLASRIFPSFHDKGYAFAKILGIVIVSYVVFLFGILRLQPFTALTIYIVFAFSVSFNIYLFLKQPKPRDTFPVVLLLIEEAIFFFCLWFWSYVRGFTPEVFGLEKYMDLGFVNSILRATYFPPKDMWFPPYAINYYYFGHFIAAVLTKASHIPSFISYNLMIATLFALAFIESFSIGATLLYKWKMENGKWKIICGGILSAALLTLAGNLHIIYTFFSAYPNEKPVPPWQLVFQPTQFPNSYWYPNATRFIYNTIHEFPIYSWVVADLHGHVSDIPIVLLTVAFLYSILISKSRSENGKWKMENGKLLLVGFLLAVMYMTNAWDGIIYFMLAGLVLCYLEWHRVKYPKDHNTTNNPIVQILPTKKLTHKITNFLLKHSIIDLFIGLFVYLFIVVTSYITFSFPFSHFFSAGAIVKGIGILCTPKFMTTIGHFGPFLFEADHCQKSPWWQLLILYGFFYFFVIIFLFFLSSRKKVKHALRSVTETDAFVLLLIFLATLLIIIPEFAYMKDIYPAHYRANTMFKLVFQTFMLLSLSSGYIIFRTLTAWKHIAKSLPHKLFVMGYTLFVVFLLALVFTYPYMATKSYYGDLKTYQGLDGLQYLNRKAPNDYAAVMWMNEHINGQPVILEAQGDSYTDYGRISSNTGLPTILGWTVHEWLWRGSYDIPAPRISEVQTVYETPDANTAKPILNKYHVQYVIVSDLEHTKYPNLSEAKFNQLGKKVFAMGNTKIYHLTIK